ncbi:MAG TPA: hypothetical protein VLS89_18070 [Candidatus Nanopelagicales bacterium]|nr:hypothetical protein [Candidatus Nanopelagicales bacterium]
MPRSIAPRLAALCAASLSLLAGATASAMSFGLTYTDVEAEIVCTTKKGDVLVNVTGAALIQGGSGLEAIFDDAYAILLLDDEGSDEELGDMKALAVEELASAEQILDALFLAYPEKLVADDEEACFSDHSTALLSLHDHDLLGELSTNAQIDCKGSYSGDIKMDLVQVLGWDPPYVEETVVLHSIAGSRSEGWGFIRQELATFSDYMSLDVSCMVSTQVSLDLQ